MAQNTKLKVIPKKSQSEPTLNKQVWDLFTKGHYNQAIAMLQRRLKRLPDCHWSLFQISCAYYEKKNYRVALRYAEKAMKINPDCPLSRWHYAGALDHTANFNNVEANWPKAYKAYKSIIDQGIRGLDRMPCCNEGHEENLGLLNDCRLRIGMCCYGMGNYKEAKRWARLFIKKHHKACIMTKGFGRRVIRSIEKTEAL